MATSLDKLTIGETFNLSRDPLRELNTIIKVNDNSKENIWIEFEEFVLTDTLIEHLYSFYNDYTASIKFDEPKMPIWLEGFYGSGKSHFSKIIGLLLQNIDLIDPNGKKWKAIDYFTSVILKNANFENDKAKKYRKELLEQLPLYEKQFQSKVLFINLSKYAKSESAVKNTLDSFTFALLREFNQSLGLAQSIEIAQIEKNLIKKNLYEDFKKIIKEQEEEDWEEVRKNSSWAGPAFLNAYVKLKNCDKLDANAYLEGAKSDCAQKNIEDILKEINDWTQTHLSIPEKGIQGKFLIILDEAGIYFSAKASRIGEMMAAAEWVHNRENESCINMIFNAQQSIKNYFENVKTTIDYRTAEQRFKKWFLDKRNIKTVVVNRWLKKDEGKNGQLLKKTIEEQFYKITYGSTLETIKDPNQDYIKPTRKDVFETYPFLPYQFPLMIKITQALITEKIVEEQYGGKTRSILSMTRDVLIQKLKNSSNQHFVDEPAGTFVTLPQIYDCITYTLKTKEEDQFIMVENVEKLVEDPNKFTPEERNLPFSFQEVMKIVLLLTYVEEIYASELNIAKSLFNSLNYDKNLIAKKVKKLIEILKQRGNLSYHRREFENAKGEKREIWEYKIASREEQIWIEKLQNIIIKDNDYEKRLKEFFKESNGKDLIDLRDQIYINKLIDEKNKEYLITNPVRMKISWFIDPDLQTLQNKINTENDENENNNSIYAILITPLKFYKHINELKKLERDIIKLSANALKKNKIVFSICPSFSQSRDNIISGYQELSSSLETCIRIDATRKKGNIPGNIQQDFIHRTDELEKNMENIFAQTFQEGMIYYGRQKKLRITKDNINDKIKEIIKNSFSKINKYAYLGQIKPTPTQIAMILKWTPKKRTNIPTIFRKNQKPPTETLYLFNKEGTEIQPHFAPQIAKIETEFQKLITNIANKSTNNDPKKIIISSEKLLKILQSTPYMWSIQTIMACIAALLRNNTWDVIKDGNILECADKEIIQAFEESKKNYEKFKDLGFCIAEKITQEQLTNTKDILKELFNEHVTQIGFDMINEAITNGIKNFTATFTEIKSDIQQLNLQNDFYSKIEAINNNMIEIKEAKRPIERIKLFIQYFKKLNDNKEQKEEFLNIKKTLYRIKELKDNEKLSRYYWLEQFHFNIMRDWLTSNQSREDLDIPTLNNTLESISSKLHNPDYLFEENWEKLWKEELKLWNLYWTEYKKLHDSVFDQIQNKIKEIKKHNKYIDFIKEKKNKQKIEKKIQQLRNLFTCDISPEIPNSLNNAQFTCSNCNRSYNSLELLKIRDIEENYKDILNLLDNYNDSSNNQEEGEKQSGKFGDKQDVRIGEKQEEEEEEEKGKGKGKGKEEGKNNKQPEKESEKEKEQLIQEIHHLLDKNAINLELEELKKIKQILQIQEN